MRFVTIILLVLSFFVVISARQAPKQIDKKRYFKASQKLKFSKTSSVENEPIIPFADSPVLPLQKAITVTDKIQTDHSISVKIDSSRNGFGWLNPSIRSIDRFSGIDAMEVEADFIIAAYRQYILSNLATGIIGATTVDVANGLENGSFYRHVELNQDLGPFPPANPYNTVGGRFPGAVALDRPFIHFNEYVSGNAKDTPALSNPYLITDYGSYGIYGGAWTPSMRMDEGYQYYNFEHNRLWNGPVSIVKNPADGVYHYVGVYRNWIIDGESQPYNYVILTAESDDPTSGWTINTTPAVIDTNNLFLFPAISMNTSGFGVCMGVGHAGPHHDQFIYYSELRLMVMTTEDYGKTWSPLRELDWPDIGIPLEITAEDSVYVPADPGNPEDTTLVIYEGPAFVSYANFHGVDVLVTEDNQVFAAYDLTGGPVASDSTYMRSAFYCGLHLVKSTDKGQTFRDIHVTANNGFYVGDEYTDLVEDDLFFNSEADISVDENGTLYLTWLDRPHTGIEPAEKNRYGDQNEGIMLKADVFTARSLDGGETWTWKMNVTQTKSVDEYELNAVRNASSRNNGTVWFAYCEVDPSTPIDPTKGEEDTYIYRVNRVWVGEAYNYPDTGVGISDDRALLAKSHVLLRNYPNPFNPETQIEFKTEQAGKAVLAVYDVNGRLVKKVFDQRVKANQLYKITFKANDLASGVYFYRLNVNGHFTTRKMVLMR